MRGTRWTAANSYLAAAASRPNLHVVTGHAVARVTLESGEGGRPIASGVELRDSTPACAAARRAAARGRVAQVVRTNAGRWTALAERVASSQRVAKGAGRGAQLAAAQKLIDNHVRVLHDTTDPEPFTQQDLPRVASQLAHAVDDALLAVAEALLDSEGWSASGRRPKRGASHSHLVYDPQRLAKALGGGGGRPSAEKVSVWLSTAALLAGRLQSSSTQQEGRAPDMDPAAAAAMCAALHSLETLAARHAPSPADQAAAAAAASGGSARRVRLAAGGEVLLAAGALGSPQLLQLSGIGPAETLEAAGVPVRVPLPSVGEGLQDHPAVTVAYESCIRDGMAEIKPWMPYLDVISPLALWRWAVRGGGILATTFCDHGAFVRSDPSDRSAALPDVQLRFVPGIGPAADGVRSYELLGKGVQHANYGYTLQVINCRPHSRGSVRITSSDPAVAPQVRCNYLASEADLRALTRGVALARRLAKSGALHEVSGAEVYPGPDAPDGAPLEEYIRQTLHSANGLSGGCCIGSVVDEQLRVKGVGGLRVADASVMPRIPGGQLTLPTTMIAERAARMVRDAAAGAVSKSPQRASRSPARRPLHRT